MKIRPVVIDISHYDDVEVQSGKWVGFDKVRSAGYIGVINKVTQGRGMTDKSYARRRSHAILAGLEWGAYHYMDRTDPVEQAAHFLDEADPDNHTLLALDYEDRRVSIDSAAEFMRAVKQQVGRYPWLYSGFLIKEKLGNHKDAFWSQMKLWLAHYNENPTWPAAWDKPTLWQFTGDGVGPLPHTVPGVHIPGGCDINSFDGSDDELRAIWAT